MEQIASLRSPRYKPMIGSPLGWCLIALSACSPPVTALSQSARPEIKLVALRMKNRPLALTQYVPPTEGLVGWWRGEGNGYDSANNQNGLLLAVRFEPGLVGQAFSFAGNPNRVFIPDGPNFHITNSVSIAAWVHPKVNGWNILERTCLGSKYGSYTLRMDNAGNVVV